jgi:hypothetical protein
MQYDAWNMSNLIVLTHKSYFTNLPLVFLVISMHFMNLNKFLWFYEGPKQYKEVSYQDWTFLQAYSIFYHLFTASTEIKS